MLTDCYNVSISVLRRIRTVESGVVESGHWLRDAKRRVKGVIVKDELTGLDHEFLERRRSRKEEDSHNHKTLEQEMTFKII